MMTIAIRARNTASSAIALSLLMLASVSHAALGETPVVLEAEESDIATMEPPKPEWFFVDGGWNSPGTSIFDGKTGKMKGMVETRRLADMAIDPAGKYYYVAETIWSKGDRGTRQDMVTVYDSRDLKLVTEIVIPDRILIGGRTQTFVVSDDGKTAYIYNLSPASSVHIVDLVKRKFVRTVELPGCASMIPNKGVGFSALCSDGSLATVSLAGGKSTITRSEPFFSATGDPVFDNLAYDKAKGEATLLTYTGLIYTVKLGATPVISQPFSIQAAAGVRPGETKPLDLNWYPGGNQQMALHAASGKIYVLMHEGEFWSHKEAGSEIWVVDLATKMVVKRYPLDKHSTSIAVSQGADPLLFVNDGKSDGLVIDATTWEEKSKIEDAGGGLITVADASGS